MLQDEQCSSCEPFLEASNNTISKSGCEHNHYHYQLGTFIAVNPDPDDGDQYPICVGRVLRVGRKGRGLCRV